MDCADFQQQAVRLREGRAVALEELAALEHLRSCPACAQHVAAHPTLRETLARVYADVGPPRYLCDRIRSLLNEPEDEPRRVTNPPG